MMIDANANFRSIAPYIVLSNVTVGKRLFEKF